MYHSVSSWLIVDGDVLGRQLCNLREASAFNLLQ